MQKICSLGSQHCGIRTPHGLWFMSHLLLHFRSGPLLMCMAKIAEIDPILQAL